jgi:hypothetical protein
MSKHRLVAHHWGIYVPNGESSGLWPAAFLLAELEALKGPSKIPRITGTRHAEDMNRDDTAEGPIVQLGGGRVVSRLEI